MSSIVPVVHCPPGLEPLSLEGWGEVQTPFRITRPGLEPRLGDPVICRHAKAGEMLRFFRNILLIDGGQISGAAPTYRGLGKAYF